MKVWFLLSVFATIGGLIAAIVFALFWFTQQGSCGFVRFYEHIFAELILGLWFLGMASGLGLSIHGKIAKSRTLVPGALISSVVCILMTSVCVSTVTAIINADYSKKSIEQLLILAEKQSDPQAAGELGLRKEIKSLPVFCAVLKDSTRDRHFLRNVLFSLDGITSGLKKGSKEYEETFSCLLDLLNSDTDVQPEIRSGIAGILGNLGDKRALEPLLSALKSETDEYARDDIVVAIKSTGGDEYASLSATPDHSNLTAPGSSEFSSQLWTSEKVFLEKPSILWRFKTKEKFSHNSALMSHGLAYFGTQDGIFYAVNVSTGELVWKFETHAGIMSRYPVQDNQYVFFGAGYGFVYALDKRSGFLVWKQKVGRSSMGCNPCISGDTVVFPKGQSSLIALDCKNGEVRWEVTLEKESYQDIYIDSLSSDGTVITGIGANTLYTMDAATGRMLWSKPLRARIDCYNPLSVVDGILYYIDPVGSGTMCVARNSMTGEALWKHTVAEYVLNTGGGDVVVKNGRAFAIMDKLFSFDAKSGNLIWQTDLKKELSFSQPSSRLLVDGGIVLLGTTDRVAAFSADTGRFLWTVTTGGMVYSRPIASKKHIYFGCEDAAFYCLGYDKESGRTEKLPFKGPIPLENKKHRYNHLILDNQVIAWRASRTSIMIFCLDFENMKVRSSYRLPGANLLWSENDGKLWTAGQKIGVCEVTPETGALSKKVSFGGLGLSACKIIAHGGDIFLAETTSKKDPHTLVAFSKSRGNLLWSMEMGKDMTLLETTDVQKRFYVGENLSNNKVPLILSLDAETGKILWKTSLKKPVDMLTTAIEKAGTFYLGCNPPAWRYTPVFALDVNSGKIRWQADIEGTDTTVATADEKMVFILNYSERKLIALDVYSGKEMWSQGGYTAFLHDALQSTPYTSPLVLQKDNVTVVTIDRKSGEILAEETFPEKIAAVDVTENTIFVTSEEGNAWMLLQ